MISSIDNDNGATINFTYDPLGRRIQKDVTLNQNTKSTYYYYSGHQMIEERDSTENVLRQFIYGSGIDEILRMDKYGDSGRTPYYFHTNANGSVTAITDANGDLVERVSYDGYGMPTFTDCRTDPLNPQTVSHSVIGNDLLFHGRRYDKETNLYYYRARYYDPTTGRFLQYDPKGYYDSMNLYQAFNMNGVNFLDPMGLYKGSSEEVKAVQSEPGIINPGEFLKEDFKKFSANFKSSESFLEYSAWWLEGYGKYVPGLSAGINLGTSVSGKTVSGETISEDERSSRLLWGGFELASLGAGYVAEKGMSTFVPYRPGMEATATAADDVAKYGDDISRLDEAQMNLTNAGAKGTRNLNTSPDIGFTGGNSATKLRLRINKINVRLDVEAPTGTSSGNIHVHIGSKNKIFINSIDDLAQLPGAVRKNQKLVNAILKELEK
jgi:RHS repeat-associated protein